MNVASYFRQAWLVLLLAVTLGGALAAVDRSLQPRIERNAADLVRQAVFEVVPGGERSEPVMLGEQQAFRVTDGSDRLVGWAVRAESMGFVDRIELLIGLSPQGDRLTGLAILDSKETPGLGERIRSDEFRGQFAERPAQPALQVVKAGATAPQPVQAITGATISSKAVTDGVNRALESVRAAIAERQTAASHSGGRGGASDA